MVVRSLSSSLAVMPAIAVQRTASLRSPMGGHPVLRSVTVLLSDALEYWIPAFAGMTSECGVASHRVRREHAPADLILFDRLKQGLEVAFAEPVVTLALDEFEENRSDRGLAEALQQHFREAAVDHALAVDQDAVPLQPLDRFAVLAKPLVDARVIDIVRLRHEGHAAAGERLDRLVEVLGAEGDMLNALALVHVEIFLDLSLGAGVLVDWDADLA